MPEPTKRAIARTDHKPTPATRAHTVGAAVPAYGVALWVPKTIGLAHRPLIELNEGSRGRC